MLHEMLEIPPLLAIALLYWHEHRINPPWRGRLFCVGYLVIALLLGMDALLTGGPVGAGPVHGGTVALTGWDDRRLI